MMSTLTWPASPKQILTDLDAQHDYWIAQGRWPDWERLLFEATRLPEAQDPLLRAHLLLKIAITHRLRGNYVVAGRLFESVSSAMTDPQMPRYLQVEWQQEWAYLLHRIGEGDRALQLLEAALLLARDEDDMTRARVLERFAGICATRNQQERARSLLDEAEQPNLPAVLQAQITMGRSFLAYLQGNWPEALQLMQSVEQLTAQDAAFRLAFLVNYGIVLFQCQIYDQAHSALREALERAERVGNHRTQAHALANLVTLCHEAGDYHAGAQYGARAIEANQNLGDQMAVATIHCNLGQIMAVLGAIEGAWGHLEAAEQECRASRYYHILSHVLMGGAELAAQQGNWTDSLARARESVELFAQQHDPVHLGRVRVRLIQAHLRLGQISEARDLVESLPPPANEDDALYQALVRAQLHEHAAQCGPREYEALEAAVAQATRPAALAEAFSYLIERATAQQAWDTRDRLYTCALERLVGETDAVMLARRQIEASYQRLHT
jgi:tetratricopeptide (TPR) repeat protein